MKRTCDRHYLQTFWLVLRLSNIALFLLCKAASPLATSSASASKPPHEPELIEPPAGVANEVLAVRTRPAPHGPLAVLHVAPLAASPVPTVAAEAVHARLLLPPPPILPTRVREGLVARAARRRDPQDVPPREPAPQVVRRVASMGRRLFAGPGLVAARQAAAPDAVIAVAPLETIYEAGGAAVPVERLPLVEETVRLPPKAAIRPGVPPGAVATAEAPAEREEAAPHRNGLRGGVVGLPGPQVPTAALPVPVVRQVHVVPQVLGETGHGAPKVAAGQRVG